MDQTITVPKLSQARLAGRIVAYMPLAVLPALAFAGYSLPPWQFMWLLALAIFFALKWATWWNARDVSSSAARSLGYLFLWPGMDAAAFLDARRTPVRVETKQWLTTAVQVALGAALLWVVARRLPDQPLWRGWTGMVGAVLLLHFGSFRLLAFLWRTAGVDAELLMNAPLRSASLAEFWGERWNLGFHDLARMLVFKPTRRALGVPGATLLVFLASGLIHDLVISVPARGGYGLPTLYFLIQGLGLLFERSVGLDGGWRGRAYTLAVTGAPAVLLFHPAFIHRVILPMMHAIGAL